MLKTKKYQFWFCTGSQDLYGEECLEHVAEHSRIIVDNLNQSGNLPYEVVWGHYMDAHIFTCKIMDFRTSGI